MLSKYCLTNSCGHEELRNEMMQKRTLGLRDQRDQKNPKVKTREKRRREKKRPEKEEGIHTKGGDICCRQVLEDFLEVFLPDKSGGSSQITR